MTLITITDLEDRLGRPVDDARRAVAVINDVSAVIETYTGRSFTAEQATVTLPVHCGVISLPNGPVSAVSAVTDLDGNAVDFAWSSGRTVTVSGCYSEVAVTYNYGYSEVPAAIVAVAAQVAGRALGVSLTDAGIQQETLGSYSYTVGSAAASGPLGLLPHERAVLDRYRNGHSPRTIRVGSWA